ncbi:hypothetical protein EDD86DRAFT_197611 [Gorgonomyces haynaldii]|nr:hypothetical protein EDD86DRAFT_197611 [Gorgonomyces haynaldii]
MHEAPPPYRQDECSHNWSKAFYPPCALAWLILFPIGILCCLRMKIHRCSKCGEEIEADNGQDVKVGNDNAYRLGFVVGAVTETIRN